MKTTNHVYLVSFGNSDKYQLAFDKPTEANRTIENIEKDLSRYLSDKFPSETSLAYFTTARVTKLHDASEARGYRTLDASAIRDIKDALAKEIRDMESTDILNSNAPFSNI